MAKNVLLIGNFGFKNNQIDGQTIKTRNVYEMLSRRYMGTVSKYDTSNMKSVIYLFRLLWMLLKHDVIVIIPADGFLSIVFPAIYLYSCIFKKEIIHLGVGGWQYEYFSGLGKFKSHKYIMKKCKKIKKFNVEIDKVRLDLENKLGFSNLDVFPNFRNIQFNPLPKVTPCNLKLVFMARINRMKGYDILIKLMNDERIKSLNISLDFYGPINNDDRSDFLNRINGNDNCCYKGVLETSIINETLANYDILLFPTRYYTEGFPGTVLDSYISGVPVIATAWKHADEFVKNGISGFVVPFDNPLIEMKKKIIYLYEHSDVLYQMKINAHKQSTLYSEDRAWHIIEKQLK